jgi:hypothetical protein
MSKARDLSKLLTDGLSAVLADGSIGLPKLSNITTDRLVGRDSAGTGAIEQISVSGGLEFTDATGLRTTAFTGDVTKAAAGTVLTIATDAITSGKIATDAVTTAKILNDAVTTAKILNANITAAKVLTTEVAVLGTAQQYTRTHNFTATALNFASTVAWDLSLAQVAVLTLTGAATMGTPTNIGTTERLGAVYILIVKQDATGTRTLSFPFGSAGVPGYRFAGATSNSGAPTLSTGANKIDILTFVATTSTDGTHLYGVSSLNYA